MTTVPKPTLRPQNPNFSSGPCAKRPGWTPDALHGALLGRSHRSPAGKERLKLAIDMALWSMLGARGVDVLAWEDFGKRWVADIIAELKLPGARVLEADYGRL